MQNYRNSGMKMFPSKMDLLQSMTHEDEALRLAESEKPQFRDAEKEISLTAQDQMFIQSLLIYQKSVKK